MEGEGFPTRGTVPSFQGVVNVVSLLAEGLHRARHRNGRNMMDQQPNTPRSPGIPALLAAAAAVAALAAAIRIWRVVGSQQPMWPLPALYLIEMVALPVAACVALLRRPAVGTAFAWAAGGATCSFVVLGAWTVGLFYLPIALLLLGAGIIALLKSRGRLLPSLLMAVLGAALQAGIMLVVVALA